MATTGALVLISDAGLRAEIERIAAAAGIRVVYAAEPSGRKAWVGAAAVLLDVEAAQRCRELGMPRRPAVLLIAADTPGTREFEAAMVIGAQAVITLPGQESGLVGVCSDASRESRVRSMRHSVRRANGPDGRLSGGSATTSGSIDAAYRRSISSSGTESPS